MKTHVETPAAVDWPLARKVLADLKSTVRLSLALQILLGLILANYKQRLGFLRGRHNIIRHVADDRKPWDQYCLEELGIAARTADRYAQCADAAKARAKSLRAKACTKKAEALDAEETKEAAKWEKVIKKCDRAIGLLQTPVEDLIGGGETELMAHVGFLIQRQDRGRHPTAAANITQGELLEELGIKRASEGLPGGKNQPKEKSKKGDELAASYQMVNDTYEGIIRSCGEVVRNRARFHAMLESIPVESKDANAPSLKRIRNELRSIVEGDLAKLIEAVEARIDEETNKLNPAKQRRAKTTTA